MSKTYSQINATGGSGGGSGSAYVQSFNVTTDWGAASGGFYTIDIPESTHGQSTEPLVQVLEKVGADFEQVTADIIIATNGDVTLRVTEILDARFEGKIVIL